MVNFVLSLEYSIRVRVDNFWSSFSAFYIMQHLTVNIRYFSWILIRILNKYGRCLHWNTLEPNEILNVKILFFCCTGHPPAFSCHKTEEHVREAKLSYEGCRWAKRFFGECRWAKRYSGGFRWTKKIFGRFRW